MATLTTRATGAHDGLGARGYLGRVAARARGHLLHLATRDIPAVIICCTDRDARVAA
eukprot:COSAG05_NODE_10422_length_566_cov_0.929336_1_plen_56_part_10